MTEKGKNTATAVAGVAGAVVGAGVAVAATKVMADKKMRDKVGQTLTQVKDQVLEALDQANSEGPILKGGTASRGSKKVSGRSQTNKTSTGSNSEQNSSDKS